MARGTLASTALICGTAEELLQLDPVRTYPKRGAEAITRLLGASGYRLELVDDRNDFESTPPVPLQCETASFQLRRGRTNMGKLILYAEHGMSTDQLELAKWAANLLAKGITFARRLALDSVRHQGEELEETLKRAPLTPREREVVALLVAGCSTRGIASKSNLTVATVNTYLKRIFSKLGVHSRVELVARMAGTERHSQSIQPSTPKSGRTDETGTFARSSLSPVLQ